MSFPYENLQAYKKAHHLHSLVYGLLKGATKMPQYFKSQLGRASLSVVLNIAEGSAKNSAKDRRNFFAVARGSSFECASLILIMYAECEIEEKLKNALYSGYDEVSRMLYTTIKNLESSST